MSKPSQLIRWGMIGVGSVAERKSGPAFAMARGGRLVAVASRRTEAATAYARRHAVERVFETPEALMESSDVDAVYIATPPASHATLALRVASAGKPCCIEKPMAVFYRDAEAIRTAFAAATLPLFVSYYRRSLSRFLQINTWIRRAAIGAVREVHWELRRTASPAAKANWRINPQEAPGGLFEDLACHGLDLFDLFCGPILRIEHARLSSTIATAVPECVSAEWRHANGIRGIGVWDFDASERTDAVTLVGSAGTIRFSMFEDEPVELATNSGTARLMLDHPVPIQLNHVEAMNAHLVHGAGHPSMVDIRTAWVTDQILRGPHTNCIGFRLAENAE